MSILILESGERIVAEDLLRISDIYESYKAAHTNWVEFLKQFKEPSLVLKDVNGKPVKYTPYQIIRDTLPFIVPAAQNVLISIRRLQNTGVFEKEDLYRRLDRLEIPKLSGADRKGLFLLSATAAEKGGVYDA